MFQIVAGDILAFKTVFCFAFVIINTVLDFAVGTSNGFINVIYPATGAFILFPQIGDAYSTVHSAGSD
jgi:hypothetical protein